MILVYLLLMLVSFYLLAVICDEFFVESLDLLAKRLKMSSDVAGATLMAIGSSAPELFTSLIAVFRPGDHADVGAGTIVGSAIFNILVIIGASAAFRQAKLNWQPVVRDTLFYSLSIVILLVAFWDGQIAMIEALGFVGLYIVYLGAVVNWRKWFPYKDSDPIELLEETVEKNALAKWSSKLVGLVVPDCNRHPEKYIQTFFGSLVLIAVLSFVLVESAVGVGNIIGIPPAIIALTVLAAGTSIPDLLSSMIVAKKGRGDMAISNAVGSNIFDILIGLGLPWLLVLMVQGGQGAVEVSNENLLSSVFLLFATVLVVFFLLALRNWKIGPKAGWLLIGLYGVYLVFNVLKVVST